MHQETQSWHALPLNQINAVCHAFEEDWSSETGMDIAAYLGRVPEDARPTLLRNLLHIDLRRRRKLGVHPSEEDYISRLPEYADLIREEYLPSTQKHVSMLVDTVTFAAEAAEVKLPAVVRLGEYVLERELGRGAMGVVFAARHVRHGTRVALKTLPSVGGRELQRFKQEFRTLADVNHPNLVGLHTLQADGGQWFFTMDLVNGENFRSYVRPQGRLDVARLRRALAQLAVAVHALHARQVVHRDLKPSNVMVTREGELRVLDFGLVIDVTPLADSQEAEVGGTPVYMAPEQMSLQSTSPASDWYAVGVMLYQALTGKLPFTGSVTQILAEKQTRDAPAIDGDVPEDLAELCRRLLDRDPQQRPSGEEIVGILCPNQAEMTEPSATPHDRLLGREEHFQVLENAIRCFEEEDAPRTIFISGRSGEGKTVLAEQFLERVRRDSGYTVLSGRCYDRESVPFKALDTLIDTLCARLRAMPQAEVKEMLTEDSAVLAELFPVLHRVEGIATLPRAQLENVELDRVRRLASDALREIMRRLAQTTSLVWFIDDLQWGDADSAELLLEVLRSPGAPKLLLLGTYRSDEAASSRFLQAWEAGRGQLDPPPPHSDCRLEPLGVEQCIELVIGVVGADDESVRRRAREMAEETGGNPFLLSALASCYDPSAEASQPMQMDEVVARRLALLPEDARSLLDVVSISGQSLALDEAARTAGHEAVPLATIARMRTERLLRMVGSDDELTIDTYHDRIRDTVLRDMKPDSRKRLHVRLAEVIETSLGLEQTESAERTAAAPDERSHPRVYDLAYHFFEGADPRAFGYQLQAGEAAIRAHAMENAIEHLEKAEQSMPDDAEQSTRYRLWERLGEACSRSQRVQEGLRAYQNAQPFASSLTERAAVQSGIGEAYHLMGEFDAAIASFDTALQEVGYYRPKWLLRVMLESGWLLSLCQMMWLVRPCRTREQRTRAETANEVFHRVAQIYLATGDMFRYTDSSIRVAFTALRSGRADAIAIGFAKLGFNNAFFSLTIPAKWMLARARRFAENSQDVPSKAHVDGFTGAATFAFGELDEAERLLQRSLDVIGRLGDSWLRMAWHHNLRHVYSARGDSEQALAQAEIEYQMGEAVSDRETICWGLYGMADAKARTGRLSEAHQHMRRAMQAIEGRDSNITKSIALNHYGFVMLQSSDYPAAVEVLEEAKQVTERYLLFGEFMVHAYPLLVEALLGPDWIKPPSDADVRRAKRVSRFARFFGWRFPTVRSHAQRVQGRLLCALGRANRAVRWFKKAIDSARKVGTEYDLARALLDLAAVDEQRQEALRNEAVAILKRLNAVIPHAEKWQLGDAPDECCVAPRLPQSS